MISDIWTNYYNYYIADFILVLFIGVFGGRAEGAMPPLEKLISLAGQKRELGRTEMGTWQDRNGKLGGI